MLDFYNELGAAIRGRLEGANTMSRVNDALRDVFEVFILEPPPHSLGEEGVQGVPVLQPGAASPWSARVEHATEKDATPPLRALHAPCPPPVNAQESWHSNL